jgi:hypothetical protein
MMSLLAKSFFDSLKLRERVGERVQAGLLKSPPIKILLLGQCVRVSGSGPETHTPTLSHRAQPLVATGMASLHPHPCRRPRYCNAAISIGACARLPGAKVAGILT